MNSFPGKLVARDVRRRFDRAATQFDQSDFVHRHTFAGLTERLSPAVIKPERILDLGCATGSGTQQLARRYRRARIIALDGSAGMLQQARRKRSFLAKISELQGDAMRIPLQDGSIDLIFCNMLLPWIHDLPACLLEIARVLRKEGVFAFATLGPASLGEIRLAWQSEHPGERTNAFPDMHDIGDALVNAGLRDPVLDVDQLTVKYADAQALYRDLSNCGARNSLQDRCKTLTGKQRFGQMETRLGGKDQQKGFSLGLELVYGHAWGSGPRLPAGEYRLDPATISRRRR